MIRSTGTLTGEAPAADSFLASAPGREGPWTPVPASGLVPPAHGWLRVSYPRPMKPGRPSPVAADQFEGDVHWSPSGGLIVAGSLLVEASTGHTLTQTLPRFTFWSPDGRHLLLFEPHHFWTNWGEGGLLELATMKRRSIGHGQALGWTLDGDALFIRWEISRLADSKRSDSPAQTFSGRLYRAY